VPPEQAPHSHLLICHGDTNSEKEGHRRQQDNHVAKGDRQVGRQGGIRYRHDSWWEARHRQEEEGCSLLGGRGYRARGTVSRGRLRLEGMSKACPG
jgi:hypothetical protein